MSQLLPYLLTMMVKSAHRRTFSFISHRICSSLFPSEPPNVKLIPLPLSSCCCCCRSLTHRDVEFSLWITCIIMKISRWSFWNHTRHSDEIPLSTGLVSVLHIYRAALGQRSASCFGEDFSNLESDANAHFIFWSKGAQPQIHPHQEAEKR